MFLLEVKNLTKKFGGLIAVNDLSFNIKEGKITSLIGPNGAGKSTVFNLITSYYKPSKGTIIFKGKNITNQSTHQIAKMGIVRTFQKTNVFMDMDVFHNVYLGHHIRHQTGILQQFLGMSRAVKEDARNFKRDTLEIMEYLGLFSYKNEKAKNLTHGLLRVLEIAIALAVKPKLLLLDEPFTGMNTKEAENIIKIVKRIREKGITILLVEHTMSIVMNISDNIIVMNFGRKIAEGEPSGVLNNEAVKEAYLGKEIE